MAHISDGKEKGEIYTWPQGEVGCRRSKVRCREKLKGFQAEGYTLTRDLQNLGKKLADDTVKLESELKTMMNLCAAGLIEI